AYRHGYYDGTEREFRGFGMVEQRDTESFADFASEGLFPPGTNLPEEILYVPPVMTRSWFHLGYDDTVYHDGFAAENYQALSDYRKEYWTGDAQAISPDQSALTRQLNSLTDIASRREAIRTLRGSLLRKEVYSLDGSAQQDNPYVVTETTYEIRNVQPRAAADRRDRDYSVSFLIPAESLSYQYERNPDDPRVTQQLTLETDQYGQVLKNVAIGYPRRSDQTLVTGANQDALLMNYSENEVLHADDEPNFYRLGVPLSARSYELTGVSQPVSGYFQKENLVNAINSATRIAFDQIPASGTTLRLLGHSRVLYFDENLDETTPLPYGQVASHSLPFESYELALTAGLIDNVLNEGTTRITQAILEEGKYTDLLSDGNYWVPSGKSIFDSNRFYLPIAQQDPFGNRATISYDSYSLLPVSSSDPLGNSTSAVYDYRVLQPELITGINGNRQAFAFDRRGMVIAQAVMGKTSENLGDSLADPTMTFEYDLFRWQNEQKPNFAKSRVREQHQDLGTRWLESYAYSNGMGQVIMTKNKVEDGEAFGRNPDGSLKLDAEGNPTMENVADRWAGNGRTVLDNKGNPIKQYEPYFSSTFEYEDEPELVNYGVTPVIHYDPMGRAIRTDLPDNTLTRVVFDPWKQVSYDENDTVLESLWYVERNTPQPTDPEPTDQQERAAWLTTAHADTPQVTHMDSLGRPVIIIDDNATDGQYKMVSTLDIKGNTTQVTDARGRQAFQYFYDMVNQMIKTDHLDSGTRYALGNVVGNPLSAFDSRQHTMRFTYDELQRPIGMYVKKGSDPEKLISYSIFGEQVSNPQANNLRGQPYMIFDQSGVVISDSFDFKGNSLISKRRLAYEYKTDPDWTPIGQAADLTAVETQINNLTAVETHSNSIDYDALNRPVEVTQPDSSTIKPQYDIGGALTGITTGLAGESTDRTIVTDIDYNALGQRKKIIYGNGSQTTYTYDKRTFRLTRLLTTKNTGADILQDLNYQYDAVGNIVSMQDVAQAAIFSNNQQIDPEGKYVYDALYRLIKSEGREKTDQNQPPGSQDPQVVNLPGT
ncbi:MAG: toxin TcdB middle/C-terminal domain-containing protein, partial [Cyclobacteriaceae bacterium]